ncbi:MAG: tRNA lysidine(34) synthetase TilS [Pseudomonadota bacterium]
MADDPNFSAGARAQLDVSKIQLLDFWGPIVARLRHEKCLVLAVSGGPDSLSMLVGLATLAHHRELDARLVVVTVDHGLREEARHEAQTVAELSAHLGLECFIERLTPPAGRGNTQAWARQNRYQVLTRVAEAKGGAIVTAHTLDDQAETFLMRAARGTGSSGLGAIKATSTVNGVRLLRPFIDVSAATLRQTLDDLTVYPAQDPSNSDPSYTRVRFRQWLGSGPEPDGSKSLHEGFAQSAALLAVESDALLHYAKKELEAFVGFNAGYAIGSLECSTPLPVRARALSLLLRTIGRRDPGCEQPSLSKLSDLAAAVRSKFEGRFVIAGACLSWTHLGAESGNIELTVSAEAGRGGFRAVEVAPEERVVWDDRFAVFNGSEDTIRIESWNGRYADLGNNRRYGRIARTLPVAVPADSDDLYDASKIRSVPRSAEEFFGFKRNEEIPIAFLPKIPE